MITKRIFLNSIYVLGVVALIALWIIGDAHASSRHNNEPGVFFVALYYGVESFWHKIDYEDLNENIDIAKELLLLNQPSNDADAHLKYIAAKKDFRKVLSKLNSKEKTYISTGVTHYIQFLGSLRHDLEEGFERYDREGQPNFFLSDSTKVFLNAVSKRINTNSVSEIESSFDSLFFSLNLKSDKDWEGFDRLQSVRKDYNSRMNIALLDSTYSDIFGQPPPPSEMIFIAPNVER